MPNQEVPDIQNLLKFFKLTHTFQHIQRRLYVTGEERWENDAEHSYQLALIAWYIVQKEQLPLKLDKIFMYSLAHDLVEVYAGDTFAHDKDATVHASKAERERLAAIQLQNEFVDFPELHEAIQGYEHLVDEESRLVYALDKILPPTNIYIDGGKTWRELGITYEMIAKAKADKVAVSPVIKKYWDVILASMLKEESALFGSSTT